MSIVSIRSFSDSHRTVRTIPSTAKHQYGLWVGNFAPSSWRAGSHADLCELDSFDQELIADVKLKDSERVFRYVADNMIMSDGRVHMSPMIKVNLQNGRCYFLTQDASEGGAIAFERKGIVCRWINLFED